MVQLAQVVDVCRGSLAEMVDAAGGIEGQGGAAEDQCGQQVQGIAGAFDKIEQYRQGQADEGQQNPQKMGIAAHGLPGGLK